jgi:hypothetical protein
MQDAIYNQIQLATNVANTPFQPYELPTVAELSPLQQQAYQNIQSNQGVWQPGLQTAQSGIQDLAGKTSVQNINAYMNPYQSQVMDVMAKQGARNLSENLLPAVQDSFIRAGGFGGTRMGEFGARALRDTNETIMNQQAQLAQAGYGQAMGASQADLTRQQGALTQMADLARTGQAMNTADVAALESAGASQQAQAQAQLNAAKAAYIEQQNYPKQQLDWLSTQVRGMAPITPTSTTQSGSTTGGTYSASPLSQLATGLYTYKGLTS